MFTKEDILARLQNGDTVDEIAKEMTDALNDAHTEYEEAEAKRLEEQKRITAFEQEQKRVYEAKSVAVDGMLDAICDYFVAAGEEDMLNEVKSIQTDKIIELLDGSIERAKSLEKLKTLNFPWFGFDIPKVEDKKEEPAARASKEDKTATFTSHNAVWNPDVIIRDFLRGI